MIDDTTVVGLVNLGPVPPLHPPCSPSLPLPSASLVRLLPCPERCLSRAVIPSALRLLSRFISHRRAAWTSMQPCVGSSFSRGGSELGAIQLLPRRRLDAGPWTARLRTPDGGLSPVARRVAARRARARAFPRSGHTSRVLQVNLNPKCRVPKVLGLTYFGKISGSSL